MEIDPDEIDFVAIYGCDIRMSTRESRIRTASKISHTVEAMADIQSQLDANINVNRRSYLIEAIKLLTDYQSSILSSIVDEYDHLNSIEAQKANS